MFEKVMPLFLVNPPLLRNALSGEGDKVDEVYKYTSLQNPILLFIIGAV